MCESITGPEGFVGRYFLRIGLNVRPIVPRRFQQEFEQVASQYDIQPMIVNIHHNGLALVTLGDDHLLVHDPTSVVSVTYFEALRRGTGSVSGKRKKGTPESHIEPGEAIGYATLKNGSRIPLCSPVRGTVLELNHSLSTDPVRLQGTASSFGYICVVMPPHASLDPLVKHAHALPPHTLFTLDDNAMPGQSRGPRACPLSFEGELMVLNSDTVRADLEEQLLFQQYLTAVFDGPFPKQSPLCTSPQGLVQGIYRNEKVHLHSKPISKQRRMYRARKPAEVSYIVIDALRCKARVLDNMFV